MDEFGIVPDSGGNLIRGRVQELLKYPEVRDVEAAERAVKINGDTFWRCSSHAEAADLADRVGKLRDLPPADRSESIVGELRKRFDVRGVRRMHRRVRMGTRWLRRCCDVYFGLVFGVGPTVVVALGADRALLPVLITGAGLGIGIAIYASRVHQRLWPEARAERRKSLWKMVLCPISAVRAVDEICIGAMEGFDPTAVASVLCPPERASDFLARVQRKLQHRSGNDGSDSTAARLLAWHAGRMLEAMSELSAALPPVSHSGPEADAGARSYCPRCLCQFVIENGVCPDCGDTELVAFEKNLVKTES